MTGPITPYYRTSEATTTQRRCACGRLMTEGWAYPQYADGYPVRVYRCVCGIELHDVTMYPRRQRSRG